MSLGAAIPYAIPKRKKVARGQLLINGQWRDARDGATMVTTDPTTEEVITEVAKASAADAADAVDAAWRAFEEGPWVNIMNFPVDLSQAAFRRQSRGLTDCPGRRCSCLGTISLDAVKHLVLCRIERRPPRLDLMQYPHLPLPQVETTQASDYLALLASPPDNLPTISPLEVSR
jgi:hypothetical protein